MMRTRVMLFAALLLAASAPPVVSAHIPSGDGPDVHYWVTCGQTPSTWPSCAIDDARVWCAAECAQVPFLVVEITLHCLQHLLAKELCAATPA
jgi:hypothetical protein